MSGLGHNRGPSMEPGRSWRRYAWKRARADLLPKLPLEVVRMRVRRARELGLDYKAYASIRAASGHDVVALLFSSNALRLTGRPVRPAETEAGRIASLRRCAPLALIHMPHDVAAFLKDNPGFAAAARAPGLAQSWRETRASVRAVTADHGIPGDRVVLVGATMLEREWLSAGGLAGYVDAETYFERSVP